MFNKILVVCVGNICRSPTGESLLKTLLPNKTIDSAGVATGKSRLVGKPADAMAIEVAASNGVNLNLHQARQLTSAVCRDYDLILVMEAGHKEAVIGLPPKRAAKPWYLGNG